VRPEALVELIDLLDAEEISHNTAKDVLVQMFRSGQTPAAIVEAKGLAQISDREVLAQIVAEVLAANPEQVATYLDGKEQIRGWFVGQVMRETKGKANPQLVNQLLAQQLAALQKQM
jgi:aspartyl-tRNA(Asn)/glutamyl-tRNA(Gln) amidotransferase subunit B